MNSNDYVDLHNELNILTMLIENDGGKLPTTKGQLDLIKKYVDRGDSLISILQNHFKINTNSLPATVDEQWQLISHLIVDGKRLEKANTFQQVIDLIKSKNNIMILTGAGISVPCGLPDFRSRNGIYARLATDYPDLDEPQSLFDIDYFRQNPCPFFKFAKEIYPGNFIPSAGHKFIKLLEKKNKLLRNYTQNIDTLETVAGIKKVVKCHGSFDTATCMRCKYRVKGSIIKDDIMAQRIPICTKCTNENERNFSMLTKVEDSDIELPIMKPDVVFFGEGLPGQFHSHLETDKTNTDLLLVIGSSLRVRPVSHVPGCLPRDVPQILINKESLSNHRFDIELLGDCDVIVTELCRQLGWMKLLMGDLWKKMTVSERNELSKAECKEKTVFDMKKILDSQESSTGYVTRFVSVADLLSAEVTCINVPPNKYIFPGAKYTICLDDIQSDECHAVHVMQTGQTSDSSDSDED